MKITKDYLRQVIRESLEEVGEKENTNPYYLVGKILGTLSGILSLLSVRNIKDTETELEYAITIVKKLQDRLRKENLPTVSENKTISKDSIRQMIRESLEEAVSSDPRMAVYDELIQGLNKVVKKYKIFPDTDQEMNLLIGKVQQQLRDIRDNIK